MLAPSLREDGEATLGRRLAGVCRAEDARNGRGRQFDSRGPRRSAEWTGRDGERRSKIQVVADAVQFLGSPKKVGDPDGGVAEPVNKPADRPATGKYRKAS